MIITSWWWWRTPRTCLSFCCPGFLMEIVVGKKDIWDVEKRSTIKLKYKTWWNDYFFPNYAGFLMEIIVGKKKSSWDFEKVGNRSTIKTKHKTWEEKEILFFSKLCWVLIYGNHSVDKGIKLLLWNMKIYQQSRKSIFHERRSNDYFSQTMLATSPWWSPSGPCLLDQWVTNLCFFFVK